MTQKESITEWNIENDNRFKQEGDSFKGIDCDSAGTSKIISSQCFWPLKKYIDLSLNRTILSMAQAYQTLALYTIMN